LVGCSTGKSRLGTLRISLSPTPHQDASGRCRSSCATALAWHVPILSGRAATPDRRIDASADAAAAALVEAETQGRPPLAGLVAANTRYRPLPMLRQNQLAMSSTPAQSPECADGPMFMRKELFFATLLSRRAQHLLERMAGEIEQDEGKSALGRLLADATRPPCILLK
jgi:hypothetical protein